MQWRVVLCAVLVLAVSAAHAESVVVSDHVHVTNIGFNGDDIDLRYVHMSTVPHVVAQVSQIYVSGAGMRVKGYDAPPLTTNTVADVSVLGIYVDDATITLDGYMPYKTAITLRNITAKMKSPKPLFLISSLHLHNEASIAIQAVDVAWDTPNHREWVAKFVVDGEPLTILSNSGLYFLQIMAQNAIGIIHITTKTEVTMDYSSFTLDFAVCKNCYDALLAISTNINMRNVSLLRVGNCSSVKQPLVRLANILDMQGESMFTNTFSEVIGGKLFNTSVGIIKIGRMSIVGFEFLKGDSGGVIRSLFSKEYATVYGRGCVIKGKKLKTFVEFSRAELFVGTILSDDGRFSDGRCSYWYCLAHRYNPNPTKSCMCTCARSYVLPLCSVPSDPVYDFLMIGDGTKPCAVPNCATCGSTRYVCKTCADGYEMQDNWFCQLKAPPPVTTQSPSIDPNSLMVSPVLCSPHCTTCTTACYSCNTYVCHVCEPGYEARGTAVCVRQGSDARMTTAVPTSLAVALLGAALLYAV